MLEGSGFSGFWYHLGLFHSMFDGDLSISGSVVHPETNYYCYSSGCLSLLISSLALSTSNATKSISIVDTAYDAAMQSQKSWLSGQASQYDIVTIFLQRVILDPIKSGIIDETEFLKFLPRLHIIVTTGIDGAQIRRATTVTELIYLLRKTTWIPFITGQGFGRDNINAKDQSNCEDCDFLSSKERNLLSTSQRYSDWFLDGGFSRVLHPTCQHTISVPTTWKTTINGFNRGMSYETVMELWRMGMEDGTSFVNIKAPKQNEKSDETRTNEGMRNSSNAQRNFKSILSTVEVSNTGSFQYMR